MHAHTLVSQACVYEHNLFIPIHFHMYVEEKKGIPTGAPL